MNVMAEFRDFLGRRVKLEVEAWRHILAKRPWLHGHLPEIQRALKEPELVLEGTLGELLAVRWSERVLGGMNLVVVYKPLNEEAYIITAYPTTELVRLEKRRKVIWRRP